MLITSVNNDKVKELVKLKEKKYRDKTGLFFVEGCDLVDEAYKSGFIQELYILDGVDNKYLGIDASYVSKQVMKKISDMDSYSEYYAVCKKKNDSEIGDRVIILDGIQDPGNLGTIIRSAVAFSFDTVVLSPDCVDLYNPKVVRSTKGMLFNENIIVRELDNFIEELADYSVYGTDVVNGINIRNEEISRKVAIVIGNEGSGIRREVRDKLSKFIYIGMSSECESLNAGVSASILMYEVYNKWNMF